MKKYGFFLISLMSLIFLKATCNETAAKGPAKAKAVMIAKSGSTVSGYVVFNQDAIGQVTVTGEVTGLKPGKHGFHLHEKGDCSSPDGVSAGGHWNPGHISHGAPMANPHHAGDLGNLIVDKNGKAIVSHTTTDFQVAGKSANSAIGKAVIVHEKEDDLKTQPTGAAGNRVGCGVIEITQ